MASIVVSPSLTPIIPKQNYDVLLSYRGKDTRYNFTSHLYAALTRHQVKTYIDNELERGNEISPSILKAINHAKLSIIVFSESYASSSRCLEELVSILKCKNNHGQILVPIYYHVKPKNIRNQTGTYGVALAEHEKCTDMNKVETWRLALTEAANLSGWDCLGTTYESGLVEKIAKDILQKLEAITSMELEGRINTYEQIAEEKQEKSLRTCNLVDKEELTTTLSILAELKLEKASGSNDLSVWGDVIDMHKRILYLKMEKWLRTRSAKDEEDRLDSATHLCHVIQKRPFV